MGMWGRTKALLRMGGVGREKGTLSPPLSSGTGQDPCSRQFVALELVPHLPLFTSSWDQGWLLLGCSPWRPLSLSPGQGSRCWQWAWKVQTGSSCAASSQMTTPAMSSLLQTRGQPHWGWRMSLPAPSAG